MTSAGGSLTVARSTWAPWALLVLGVVSASVAAILIRYARDAEPLAISFWRCAAGAGLLAPFAGARLRARGRVDPRVPAIAGAFLAVHFATWITSLELTSIAASVLLVSISPVFVALASWWLFKERLRGGAWIGILLTLAGTALIAGGDLSGSSFRGNLLAFVGGVTAGGYVLAGQIARRSLGILEYSVITYAVAGVLILVACIVSGVRLVGYDAGTWMAIAGLIAGPQLLGHTVINFVLRDIDATTVSVAIMAEPVIATALAFALFNEVPSLLVYPGGVAILLGIYLVSTIRRVPPMVVD